MTRKGKVSEADGQPVDEAQRTAMIQEVRRIRAVLAQEAIGQSNALNYENPVSDMDAKVQIARGLVERMLFQDVAGLQLILDGLVAS